MLPTGVGHLLWEPERVQRRSSGLDPSCPLPIAYFNYRVAEGIVQEPWIENGNGAGTIKDFGVAYAADLDRYRCAILWWRLGYVVFDSSSCSRALRMAHGRRLHALLGHLPDRARHQHSRFGNPHWSSRRLHMGRGVVADRLAAA